MLKLILSMLLMLCSLFIGQSMSLRLNRRKEALSLFLRNIHTAATKLAYSAATVYELFDEFAFEKDMPFMPQWIDLLSGYKNVLHKKDIALLKEFAQGLGSSDTKSQIKHIKLYLSLLDHQLCDAQNDIDKKSRLYRVLGFSAGVTLSLMLV